MAVLLLAEKAIGKLPKDFTSCFEQILEAESHKTASVRSLASNLSNNDEQNMLGTAGEAEPKSLTKFFNKLTHINIFVLTDQQRLRVISFMRTLDAV